MTLFLQSAAATFTAFDAQRSGRITLDFNQWWELGMKEISQVCNAVLYYDAVNSYERSYGCACTSSKQSDVSGVCRIYAASNVL